MRKLSKVLIALVAVAGTTLLSQADHHQPAHDGATIITEQEVQSTIAQGLANLAEGRTISDIVVRHVDVGEENMGVSIVQRSKVEPKAVQTGIAHVDLDEIYYIVSGEGTMITGGEFVDMQTSEGGMLGPMQRGELRGGVRQQVGVGDIAIIPKGMPHGWYEITTETIGYIIFRGDPNEVMELKYTNE